MDTDPHNFISDMMCFDLRQNDMKLFKLGADGLMEVLWLVHLRNHLKQCLLALFVAVRGVIQRIGQ